MGRKKLSVISKFTCNECNESWYGDTKDTENEYLCPTCGQAMGKDNNSYRIIKEDTLLELRALKYQKNAQANKSNGKHRTKISHCKLLCYRRSCKRRRNKEVLINENLQNSSRILS